MGLTQTALARLSGLSRATVNQVETGTIRDLSLVRTARLLGTLGLSVNVSPPYPKPPSITRPKSAALEIAARTASVSYRTSITPMQLRLVFTEAKVLTEFLPHVFTLLEEAPISLLASVVEELHAGIGIERPQVWSQMRQMARQLKSGRELWL
jgi:transcriptional regulator with XRE-family HTH domain